MSESAPISSEHPLIQTLSQISRLCISPDAEIEPGANIKLWTAPGGRHTEIGAAHIETGAIIEELTHVHDGVSVGEGTHLGFRATIKKECQVGQGAVVGTAATLEEGVRIAPRAEVGNFSRIGMGCEIDRNTEVAPQVFVAPGISVHEKIGPHTTVS